MPAWIASEIEASDPDSVELSSGSYQFFEFFAYWCGTCLALAPEIHTLETHYGSRINFIYLDIDDPANDIYKKQLNYRQQPQFYLVDREGKVIREWQGTVAFDELVSAFESILSIQQ
jgi:thiol-disulfide isomerase/thioredoxin